MTKKQVKSYKILVANGVNLDLLGVRQPEIYGTSSLKDLEASLVLLQPQLESLFQVSLQLVMFQSNHEGEFLETLSKTWDGILLNPGAWTHTSLALADRLAAVGTPFVEVHISNLATREDIRHISYSAPLAVGVSHGFGLESYHTGLFGLLRYLKNKINLP